MGFIFKIFLAVGVIVLPLYWFFHDSPLLQKHLSSPVEVHGGWPVEYIAVKIIDRGVIGGKEYEISSLIEAHKDAVMAKFYNSISGNEQFISRQQFLDLEKMGLATSWLPGLDRNKNNQVDISEWNVQDAFIIHNVDTNQDQIISPDEFWITIQRKRESFFRKSDRNRDGKLSLDEYKAAYGKENAAKKFANELDINNNVVLEPAELRAAKLVHRVPF